MDITNLNNQLNNNISQVFLTELKGISSNLAELLELNEDDLYSMSSIISSFNSYLLKNNLYDKSTDTVLCNNQLTELFGKNNIKYKDIANYLIKHII